MRIVNCRVSFQSPAQLTTMLTDVANTASSLSGITRHATTSMRDNEGRSRVRIFPSPSSHPLSSASLDVGRARLSSSRNAAQSIQRPRMGDGYLCVYEGFSEGTIHPYSLEKLPADQKKHGSLADVRSYSDGRRSSGRGTRNSNSSLRSSRNGRCGDEGCAECREEGSSRRGCHDGGCQSSSLLCVLEDSPKAHLNFLDSFCVQVDPVSKRLTAADEAGVTPEEAKFYQSNKELVRQLQRAHK